MSYQWFIGIDVSKQTLDITVLNNNEKKMYEQIVNSDQSIKSFLKKSLLCRVSTISLVCGGTRLRKDFMILN